jgi:hypothetical protein
VGDDLLVDLSRLQFATTTLYHYLFVPLTLGLAPYVALLETLHWRTGKESYRRLARFFGSLLIINFAMGIVTGIVQEFAGVDRERPVAFDQVACLRALIGGTDGTRYLGQCNTTCKSR